MRRSLALGSLNLREYPGARVSAAPIRRKLPVSLPSGLPALAGSEHLGFRCSGCGDCCRRLRVAITHHDLRRLCTGLQRPAATLVDWLAPEHVDMTGEPGSFVRLAAGRRLMVLAQAGGACSLLQPDQRCGAYALRPLDCRLFPFDLQRDERGEVVRLSRLDPDG